MANIYFVDPQTFKFVHNAFDLGLDTFHGVTFDGMYYWTVNDALTVTQIYVKRSSIHRVSSFSVSGNFWGKMSGITFCGDHLCVIGRVQTSPGVYDTQMALYTREGNLIKADFGSSSVTYTDHVTYDLDFDGVYVMGLFTEVALSPTVLNTFRYNLIDYQTEAVCHKQGVGFPGFPYGYAVGLTHDSLKIYVSTSAGYLGARMKDGTKNIIFSLVGGPTPMYGLCFNGEQIVGCA